MPLRMLKIRLYPTKAQITILETTLQTCREVYNSFLLWRIVAWETEQKSVGYYEQAVALPKWKAEHPELKEVYAQVLQNVAVRVDLAFKAFFRRCKSGDTPGFPRFKGRGYDSLTYSQSGFTIGEKSVTLSKIGVVKAVVHRRIEGVTKTCTIRRQGDKWYACFAVEVESEPLTASDESVGVDVGVEKFASLSNGEFIENPRFVRKDTKALAKAQRKVDKYRKGSPDQRKARKVVRRIHERIRNRRHNFIHQQSRAIVNRFGLIAVEKLNVANLTKSPAPKHDEATDEYLPNGAAAKAGLNKSILDAAWTMFRNALLYKAESASRTVVEVNPAWTSQDCSGCGTRAKKKLSDRWHFCPHCGLSLDRDTNAALNILKIGMGQHTIAG